ncbi:MAG: hypothetical protein QN161_11925, partial [Armatimonadota bacterium]|nr:hypothetical protein [Armatimonadota bacterium]
MQQRVHVQALVRRPVGGKASHGPAEECYRTPGVALLVVVERRRQLHEALVEVAVLTDCVAPEALEVLV